MKCLILLVLPTLIPFHSSAQNGYRVTYETTYAAGFTINSQPVEKKDIRVVVFNDSFYYTYPTRLKDHLKKNTVFGDKYYHHAYLYDKLKDSAYSYNAWPVKSKAYVVATYKPVNKKQYWVIDSAVTYQYKDYQCNKAYSIDEKGDSIFVVFTTDLPCDLCPPGLTNLRGLILEYYHPAKGYYYTIKKIERNNYYFRLPENADIRSSFKK